MKYLFSENPERKELY